MKRFKLLASAVLILIIISCQDEIPLKPIDTGSHLDNTIINDLITKISNGDFGEIHSLLIYIDNTLVVEKYFRDYDQNDLHVCYSVTKSVTSALIGIAIEKGYLNNVDGNILGFFPEYNNIQNPSQWKNSITLHHVLSMSAGFQWDEFTLPYTNPNNDVRKLISSPDWIKYVLDLPVITQPGISFTYNSGCSTLLGGVIHKSTGIKADQFCETNLFNPLRINNWAWEQGPNGVINTFGGLKLKPIDMLKFGRLFLQKGYWDNQQLINQNWINNSISTKINISSNSEYAYQWWRFTSNSSFGQALQTNDVYYADGWGGQLIFVVPHLNMVVVSTGGNFNTGNEPIYFFRDYILPAAYTGN